MIRWFLVIPAGALFLAVAGGAHAYVAQCMVIEAGFRRLPSLVAYTVLAIGCLLLVAYPIAERLLPPRLGRFVAWPASIWMGLLFWLLLALGLSDLLLWLASAFAEIPAYVRPLRAAGVGSLVLVAGAVGLREALRGPHDVRLEIELERWPRILDGYRIVQITDIHIGAILDRRFAQQLTERVNALDPDLVAVTGDLVDGPPHHLREEVRPFAALRGRDGVFFVTGNHDFYSGVEPWAELARGLGMRVLRNERLAIRSQRFAVSIQDGVGAAFELAGVDDHRANLIPGEDGEDLDRALGKRTSSERRLPIVLLAHDPSTFKRAHRMGIDLQISGHTHGGQIWPFYYFVRAVIPFVAGRYRRGEAELYVSRGSGFWGPPMRLFAPAEVTEIVLRSPAARHQPA